MGIARPGWRMFSPRVADKLKAAVLRSYSRFSCYFDFCTKKWETYGGPHA